MFVLDPSLLRARSLVAAQAKPDQRSADHSWGRQAPVSASGFEGVSYSNVHVIEREDWGFPLLAWFQFDYFRATRKSLHTAVRAALMYLWLVFCVQYQHSYNWPRLN